MADPRGFLTARERELPPRRPVPRARWQDWNEVYEPADAAVAAPAGRPLHGLRDPVLPQRLSARAT